MARDSSWLNQAILLAAGTVAGIGIYKCFVKPWMQKRLGPRIEGAIERADRRPGAPIPIPVEVAQQQQAAPQQQAPAPRIPQATATPQRLPQVTPEATPQQQAPPERPGFITVDGLIGLLSVMFERLNGPQQLMPTPAMLRRVFTGRRVNSMTPQAINFFHGMMYEVRDIMDREGYPHNRPGVYDVGGGERVVLVQQPDRTLRIDLDQSSF